MANNIAAKSVDTNANERFIKSVLKRRDKSSNPFIRIGFSSSNRMEIDQNIRDSKIPLAVIKKLGKELEISDIEAMSLVHVTSSTISRRRSKGLGLKPDEADRVYRVVSILKLAEDVLGEHKRSIRWLKTPAKFLGGTPPLKLIETEAGAEEVRKLLLRIEYSVYS